MNPHDTAYAGWHKEHIAVSQEMFRTIGVQNGPGVNFGGDLEREPGRKVGLYNTCENID